MTRVRPLLVVLLLLVALVLQVSLLDALAWQGVVPNLVLLVVVAAGMTLPPQQALALGFVGGLLLDLAPPADHYVGRWALALTVVAFLVANFIAQFGIILLCIGIIPATFWSQCVAAYALGEVAYRDPGSATAGSR